MLLSPSRLTLLAASSVSALCVSLVALSVSALHVLRDVVLGVHPNHRDATSGGFHQCGRNGDYIVAGGPQFHRSGSHVPGADSSLVCQPVLRSSYNPITLYRRARYVGALLLSGWAAHALTVPAAGAPMPTPEACLFVVTLSCCNTRAITSQPIALPCE